MVVHVFNYSMKELLRSRGLVFWELMFPLILATLFYAALSNLSEGEAFQEIPVALVVNENSPEVLKEAVKSVEGTLIQSKETDEKQARKLLKDKKVIGILTLQDKMELSLLSVPGSGKFIEQSILYSFVETVSLNQIQLEKIRKSHPENIKAAVEEMTKNVDYIQKISYAKGTMDEKVTYFFNLIAMTCMYGALGGAKVAINNQGNLSALGARRNLSPNCKLVSMLGELGAVYLTQLGFCLISVAYIQFVLKISFGNEVIPVLGVCALGTLCGTGMGYFVGSIGNMSENVKEGILMGVSMTCSFLSGLMMGSIRILIDEHIPILNKINPCALISDSFYSLTVFPSYDRLLENLLYLGGVSLLFIGGGILLTRRENYASL